MGDSKWKIYLPNGDCFGIFYGREMDGVYQGMVQEPDIPEQLAKLFAKFEECVNGQVLSSLDMICEEINGLSLSVEVNSGKLTKVSDFQYFPNDNACSFRISS